MESIKVISLLLVITHHNYFIASANIRCKPGLERPDNGICTPCPCPKGHGLNISKDPVDSVAGNTSCSPCSLCLPGRFSSAETNYVCVKCSMACFLQNKITIQQCGRENDYVCGECMSGYMMTVDKACQSVESHGRKLRQQLKDDDHTVFFVLAGIVLPLWMICICGCIFKNKIGSWRQKAKPICKQPDACKINMLHIISVTDDPFDPKIDEKILIENPES